MSKEEIINATVNPLLPSIEGIRTKTREAMSQYAEQESILFAEWAAMNGWYFNKIGRWSNRGEKSENLIEVLSSTKSTTELYQLYKKETQQTKTS